MRHFLFTRLLVISSLAIVLNFNFSVLKSQTDIIDLCPVGQGQMNCDAAPDIQIPVNIDGTGTDTFLIIRNVRGYRLLNDGELDKKYKFCAPNNAFCGTSSTNTGEFQILFTYNSATASVNRIEFIILQKSTGAIQSVKAYSGAAEYSLTQSPVSGGFRYTYNNSSIAIDKVVVTCEWVGDTGMSTPEQLFVLDSLSIASACTLPGAAGSITGISTVCKGQSGVAYSTPLIANASGYSWTLPSGSVITSGVNTNSIVVSYSASASSGDITVYGTNACGAGPSSIKGITVNSGNTITLTSSAGTNNQTVCINTPILNITYSTTGATGAIFTGLPTGVTGSWAGNAITISGIPGSAGTYNYSVQLTGGCGGGTTGGTIIVKPNYTINLTSATGTNNQTVCINTPITPITYGTSGATGAAVTGLPAGLMGTFAGDVVTISGSPAVSGTYNYSIQLTGGCGAGSSVGIIIVKPENTITLTSAPGTDNQTVTLNSPITNITYSTTGASGANFTNLPSGVTGNWSGNSITISGSPNVSGTFNIIITLTGGCGNVSAGATINVSGGGPGVLLPEVVCILDLSWSMNRDFYDNPTTNPDAVKLKHAKNSLIAFMDLLYQNNPDLAALGLARFPNSPQVGCDAGVIQDIATLNSALNTSLVNTIQLVSADGNSTPLLAGIDTAINMFFPFINKTIVLLTDGMQNCPYNDIPVMIANTKTALQGSGTKLFTIGFGENGIVPNNMLNDLATFSGGKHYNVKDEPEKNPGSQYDPANPGAWDPATALDATFSHIIAENMGLDYISDPLAIINRGARATYEIPVTVLDERVCFFVSWVTSQTGYLGIKLFTPSGTEFNIAQPGVLSVSRENHTIITITNSVLRRPGMNGIWKLEIDGSGISTESEHYQYSVLNKSKKLDLKTWFEKSKYFTGDKMRIFMQLLMDGKPVSGFEKLSVQGTQPEISLGNWLASRRPDSTIIEKTRQKQLEQYLNWLTVQPHFLNMNSGAKERYLSSQKENFLKGLDPVELKVHALVDEYKLRLPGRLSIKGLSFVDNGKNGDEKAGDGIYTAIYVPKKEGSYIFNISCTSNIKDQKVVREGNLQTYVGARIRLRPVFKDIRLAGAVAKDQNTFDLIFALKDGYGNIPAPYTFGNLNISVDRAILTGSLTDNMDGTFTQKITLPGNIKPGQLSMTIASDERSESIRIRRGIPYQVVIVLVLIFVTTIGFIARRRKK